MPAANNIKRWLTEKEIRARYGNCSPMTIWRWIHDPRLNFPAPIYIKNKKYFDAEKQDKFDAELVKKSLSPREDFDSRLNDIRPSSKKGRAA